MRLPQFIAVLKFLGVSMLVGAAVHYYSSRIVTDSKTVKILKSSSSSSSITWPQLRNSSSLPKAPQFKTILLWTSWFGDKAWTNVIKSIKNAPWTSSLDDSDLKCFLTTNRSHFSKIDAVVVHGWDVRLKDVPDRQKRLENQKYVFLLLESPVNFKKTDLEWKAINHIGFNMLMSYTSSADIAYPYGRLDPFQPNDKTKQQLIKKIDGFVDSFSSRPTDALWIVSRCRAASKRELLVNHLQENGITVDMKGACSGAKPEDEWNEPGGVERFYKRYRFYLAFENSICDDYASEKLFRGMEASRSYGLIPIVYGGANYSALIPTGSFIDVLQFPNVKQLADFIRKVSKLGEGERGKEQLRRFYQWQYSYRVSKSPSDPTWRSLCRSLWQDSNSNERPSLINDLRPRLGNCHKPPSNLIGN